jgi:DNA-binding transcriptional regulator YhcF (GntR family)
MPLCLQLAALPRSRIQDGTITKRLPSVNMPSQEHAVSHTTAERALTTLKDEGLSAVTRKVVGLGSGVLTGWRAQCRGLTCH